MKVEAAGLRFLIGIAIADLLIGLVLAAIALAGVGITGFDLLLGFGLGIPLAARIAGWLRRE